MSSSSRNSWRILLNDTLVMYCHCGSENNKNSTEKDVRSASTRGFGDDSARSSSAQQARNNQIV